MTDAHEVCHDKTFTDFFLNERFALSTDDGNIRDINNKELSKLIRIESVALGALRDTDEVYHVMNILVRRSVDERGAYHFFCNNSVLIPRASKDKV